MEDVVTTIRTASYEGRPPGFLAKKIKGKEIQPYDKAMYFTSREHRLGPVSAIDDLFNLLKSIKTDPQSAILPGRKLPGVAEIHRRLKDGPERTYEIRPRAWVMCDTDGLPYAEVGCEAGTHPRVVLNKVVLKYLPAIYHNVTFIGQLSSSHGYKDTKEPLLNAHAWFILDQLTEEIEIKKHFQSINVLAQVEHRYTKDVFDEKLYNRLQIHYTADPILLSDTEPQPFERLWLQEGADRVVQISKWLGTAEPDKRWLWHLGQIGDKPGQQGFHDPLMAAIGCHVHFHGAPGPEARTALRTACSEALSNAYRDPALHTEGDVARYKRDKYLDDLIDGAVVKGFGKNAPLSKEEVEAATQRFLYVQSLDKFFDKERGHPGGANMVRMMSQSSKDITRDKTFLDKLQAVDFVRSVPGAPQRCIVQEDRWRVYNVWPGRLVEPTFGDAAIFEENIRSLCSPGAEEATLDWLAHVLANPGVKIKHALVFGSRLTGVGKSAIKDLLGKLIPHIKPIGTNDLIEKYRDFLPGIELVVCEEVRTAGFPGVADVLKTLITDSPIFARRHGRPSEEIINYSNWLFLSNHRDALPGGDRRYLGNWYDGLPKPQSFYRELYWRIEHTPGDFLGWAKRRDLSKFDVNEPPPITEYALAMARLSRSVESQNVEELLAERSPPFDFAVKLASDVLEEVNSRFRCRLNHGMLKEMIERREGEYVAGRRYKSAQLDPWRKASFIVLDEKLKGQSGTVLYLLTQAAGFKQMAMTPEQVEKALKAAKEIEEGLAVPGTANGNGHAHPSY